MSPRPPRYYARRLAAAALDFLLMGFLVSLIAIAAAQVIGPDRLRLQGGALSMRYCGLEATATQESDGTTSGNRTGMCEIRPLGVSIGYYTTVDIAFEESGAVTTSNGYARPSDAAGNPVGPGEIGWLVLVALFLTLWPWWEAGRGTPGKRALGLLVVTSEGELVPYWRAMLRTAVKLTPFWAGLIAPVILTQLGLAPMRAVLFGGMISAFLALWFWLFFAGSPFGARPGPHDRWAGTRVILKGD